MLDQPFHLSPGVNGPKVEFFGLSSSQGALQVINTSWNAGTTCIYITSPHDLKGSVLLLVIGSYQFYTCFVEICKDDAFFLYRVTAPVPHWACTDLIRLHILGLPNKRDYSPDISESQPQQLTYEPVWSHSFPLEQSLDDLGSIQGDGQTFSEGSTVYETSPSPPIMDANMVWNGQQMCPQYEGVPLINHEPIMTPRYVLQPAIGMGSALVQHLQPSEYYPGYPIQTLALKIQGDLDAMMSGWQAYETKAMRRLVRFRGTQEDSILHLQFEPISPEQRQWHDICISCIQFGGKGEYFITSADILHLLQSILGSYFSVPEKNRIRRRLASFKHTTLSSNRAETRDFFELVMGFPSPKPRNIRRDIKVYRWKVLSAVLEKLIVKL